MIVDRGCAFHTATSMRRQTSGSEAAAWMIGDGVALVRH